MNVLYSVCVETLKPLAEALFEALPFPDEACSAWIEASAPTGRVEVFFDTRAQAEAAQAAMCAIAETVCGDAPYALRIREVQREDWAESWKVHFRPEHVSERITVAPSWEPVVPAHGVHVIVLDPGMSFGTGRHGTTRACVRFLDALQRERPAASVLDIGCGTGILAISAARLGFPRVEGFDSDPAAAANATLNAAVNGVACRFHVAELADYQSSTPFGVVVANLLASVILEHRARILACVEDGGALILSGILAAQYAGVRTAFEALGCIETDRLSLDEWTSGCFVHRSARQSSSADVNRGSTDCGIIERSDV